MSKTTQTSYSSPLAQPDIYKRIPKRVDVAVEAHLSNPGGVTVAVDETVLMQSKETKKKLKKVSEDE